MKRQSLVLAALVALLAACTAHHACLDYLAESENGRSPRDGERYTLSITDDASEAVLVDETRQAVYDRSRSDDCHTCWNTELSL